MNEKYKKEIKLINKYALNGEWGERDKKINELRNLLKNDSWVKMRKPKLEDEIVFLRENYIENRNIFIGFDLFEGEIIKIDEFISKNNHRLIVENDKEKISKFIKAMKKRIMMRRKRKGKGE